MSELARFDDRWTMRYSRFYPHPIEAVWAAVTEADQLEVWLSPACGVVVDARLGGRCAFAFGSPSPHEGTITAFDPPHVVHYQLSGSSMRFELAPADGGTTLDFVHAFTPTDGEPPWHADFMSGFHLMLDQIGPLLDGTFTTTDVQHYIDAVRRGEGVHALMPEPAAEERALTARYEALLRGS